MTTVYIDQYGVKHIAPYSLYKKQLKNTASNNRADRKEPHAYDEQFSKTAADR